MEGKTVLSSSISYFNALAGSWEPAVEGFTMSLNYQKGVNELKDIRIDLDRELNINLTESLLKTVRDSYEIFKAGRKLKKVHQAFRSSGANL